MSSITNDRCSGSAFFSFTLNTCTLPMALSRSRSSSYSCAIGSAGRFRSRTFSSSRSLYRTEVLKVRTSHRRLSQRRDLKRIVSPQNVLPWYSTAIEQKNVSLLPLQTAGILAGIINPRRGRVELKTVLHSHLAERDDQRKSTHSFIAPSSSSFSSFISRFSDTRTFTFFTT